VTEENAKRRILFVDTEPNVLNGLRRMLRRMRDQWDMRFENTSEGALAALNAKPFDIMVTDLSMAYINGHHLLDEAMRLHPNVIRIALSGHSDQRRILSVVASVHQFLAKPCEPDRLKATIARACALRRLLRDDNLRQLVGGLGTLPSVPALYTRLVQALRDEQASLPDIGRVIGEDVAMTGKLLQMVNSAFFGLPRKVTSAEEAITLLGVDNVRALVLSAHIFGHCGSDARQRAVTESLQRHSLALGSMARSIARTVRHDPHFVNEVFMAGLLHDVGKLVLLTKATDQFLGADAQARRQGHPMRQVEAEIFGVSHAEVGAYLLGMWGLSDPVVEAAAYHHSPAECVLDEFCALTAVHVATAFAGEQPGTCIDHGFLEHIGCAEQLDEWRDICDGANDAARAVTV